MRNNWFFFMDLDGVPPFVFPTEPMVYVSGSLAVKEAFNCFSKCAGAILVCFTSGSNSNIRNKLLPNPHSSNYGQSISIVEHLTSSKHNLAGLKFGSNSREESAAPMLFGKIVSSKVKQMWKEVGELQPFPVLALAAALIPPLDNFSPKVLSVPLEYGDVHINRQIDQTSCAREHQRSANLICKEINWRRNAVEPQTGIEFPTALENLTDQVNNSKSTSEVLVGTGFRSMRIVKVKSVKVYAFGFYVHPDSLCEKLGPKYAALPASELSKRSEFSADLLRADVDMTVRLVVNCNGMKVNTVRNAFEKSLRARLVKMNPDTDYHCLSTFDSCFTQDISLPAGTIIDFRRTVDGQLITKIGGKQIGAVRSKDLCRAFFDMYIGDVPVSPQAKEQICINVGTIINKCR